METVYTVSGPRLMTASKRQQFVSKMTLGRMLEIRLRAYSEGTAFQYFIPEQEKIKDFTITQEDTGFTFPEGSVAWEEHGVEGRICCKTGWRH